MKNKVVSLATKLRCRLERDDTCWQIIAPKGKRFSEELHALVVPTEQWERSDLVNMSEQWQDALERLALGLEDCDCQDCSCQLAHKH